MGGTRTGGRDGDTDVEMKENAGGKMERTVITEPEIIISATKGGRNATELGLEEMIRATQKEGGRKRADRRRD